MFQAKSLIGGYKNNKKANIYEILCFLKNWVPSIFSSFNSLSMWRVYLWMLFRSICGLFGNHMLILRLFQRLNPVFLLFVLVFCERSFSLPFFAHCFRNRPHDPIFRWKLFWKLLRLKLPYRHFWFFFLWLEKNYDFVKNKLIVLVKAIEQMVKEIIRRRKIFSSQLDRL